MKTDFESTVNQNNQIKAMHSCCGGNGHGHGSAHHHNLENEDHFSAAMYQCPMRCEGEKTYSQPGKCPVCNMKLVPVGNLEHYH